MEHPVKIDTRNLNVPPSIVARIERRAAKLEKVCRHLNSCRVTVQGPGGGARKGRPFNVRLDLAVPGRAIVVNRHDAQNLAVAVREAFEAARRKLQEHSRIRRNNVKTHRQPPQGQILRLFPKAGYGFIQDASGREIYFHRNTIGRLVFSELRVGTQVRFTEEQGEEGPRAHHVSPL